MALVFEQILTRELGDASYLIGDDSARVAAVVDPQVDVEQYLELARKRGLSIKYVVQTHIHEDFLSGACALAAAAGGAQVCVGGHNAPEYGFPHRAMRQLKTLDKRRPTAVYCDSGYRASIAASLLQSHGFEVSNVPGSWQAWKSSGLPMEVPDVGGKGS